MADEEFTDLIIVTVGGRYRCTYLNDHRIDGPEAYISEGPKNQRIRVRVEDLKDALKGLFK